MSNYGWTNSDGEPIMSGEAWRFEQQLDLDAQADYYEDHFYDQDPDEDRYDECPSCEGEYSFDTQANKCDDCGFEDSDDGYVVEDQHLDSFMEDFMSGGAFGD